MIHETAIISPEVHLGRNVSIGPYSVVEAQVEIGDDCVIGPHVTISRYTTIGAGCQVHAGAAVGGIPQDMDFDDTESHVVIGSRCIVREGVTIHRGTGKGTVTKVGNDCFLMAFSHVAHNCELEDGVILANGALLAGHVHVGSRVFISGGAGIHQFVKIGRLAFIGGNSLCGKDVPPYCMVEPCTFGSVKGLNTVGMRRAGMSSDERLQVKRIFKLVYKSGLNVKQALAEIEKMDGSIAQEMAEFIHASKRGLSGSGTS